MFVMGFSRTYWASGSLIYVGGQKPESTSGMLFQAQIIVVVAVKRALMGVL
jgi:hypothetical protein